MNKDYFAEALDEISDDHIVEACSDNTETTKPLRCYFPLFPKISPIYKAAIFVVTFACILTLVILIGKRSTITLPDSFRNSTSQNKETAKENMVTIPKADVNLSTEYLANACLAAPMVIYQGHSYFGIIGYNEKMKNYKTLIEEHLGTSTGTIDAWTKEDGYVDFAGSETGELYSIKGYDPSFLIGLETTNGSSESFHILINNNDITLKKGSDLFEDRLHLLDNYTTVTYQSHDDWYYDKGHIQTYDSSYKNSLAAFVNALNQAEFMWTDDIPLEDKDSNIYDEKEICHLYFKKEDGITIQLRCLRGGYVLYTGIYQVCLKIPQDTFQTICYAFRPDH